MPPNLEGAQRKSLINSLEKWGTQSMTETEISQLRGYFGDKADEVLQYYNF